MPKPQKMMPRKSTRATPSSPSLDRPTPTKKDDVLTSAKPTLEEKTQKKHKSKRTTKKKSKAKEVGEFSPTDKESKSQVNCTRGRKGRKEEVGEEDEIRARPPRLPRKSKY